MLRQKPLVVSLILAGLFAATQINALGLDRLNVTTALGQPLVAEVELSVAPGDDIDSIRANIASPAVYRAAGVEYQGIVQTIRVQVLRRPNGKPYLRLASSQSINDPYLDILVEVNSSTGRLVREYVFLLDPPATAVAQNIEPAQPPRPAMPALSAPSPRPAPAPSSARSAPSAPVATAPRGESSGGRYSVRAGDTLSGIAGRNAQPGVTIEQLMIAIQRSNPDAFIGGNINRLRAGASLNLPSSGDAQAIATDAANNEVRAQAASWRGYVARVSDAVPNVASDAPSARASGRVSGAVADTGTGASNSDKLKLSQGERNKQQQLGTESKVAAAKALKEEQSRAAQLEQTKQDLEKALSLKNQAMADAQAKAQAAAKTAPPQPAPVVVAKVEPPKPAVTPPAALPPAPAPVAIAKVDPPKPVGAPVAPPPPVVAPPPQTPPPAPVVVVVPPPAPQPVLVPVPVPVSVPTPVVVPPPPPSPVPVAPAPLVAAKSPAIPATTPPAEPGVMNYVADNPMPAAAVGLGLLALLAAFLWSRNRKQVAPSAHSKMSDPVINTINPDTVFGTSGLGVVKTNDVPVQSQFSRSGMGTIDSGEVDPVAEAEVYIAYGREAQAEEILREALQRDSQRPDVATKLAEISAMQGKRDSFDKLAADIVAMDRSGEYKQKLIALAAAHFPGHPLVGAATASTTGGATTLSIAPTAVTAGTAAAAAAAAGYASIDIPTTPDGTSLPVTAPSGPSSGSLDFVLDDMTITKPSAPSAPALVASAALLTTPSTAATSPMPFTQNGRKSLEDDLAELEASLKKATKAGQVSESGMDFTDFSTATPTNLGTVGPSMRPEMLDLSFDAERKSFVDPTPSILDGQWHDASTKLDLARAYEEMGDREGAREILREVIHDGDEVQITEAKAMLAKLGG